ncbi:MAG: matrixin family metalloprotease, partial [Planctomycetota bacterium]
MIPRRISNPRARGRRGSAGGGALRPAAIAFLAVTLLLLSPHQGAGYFPITSSGVSLSWNGADQPVTYVIQSAGSGDIPDESDDLALRLAFRRWEDSSGSSIAFLEDTSADANRTDFGAFDIHLILFDESNQTGYFPGGSTVVALTPITFNLATGRIVDADILFNGGANSFSTDKTPGTFDIQSVATHEIGHFIGLDHGASCASTMFPFAALARVRQRSLTDDDRGGARHIYSGGPATGTISGTLVRQSNGTPVAGAHLVAVNSDGVVATGTYSEANGAFAIAQLPTGSYTVYAEPLDGPVAGSNLSSTIGASAATDFGTTYVGGNSSPSSIVVIASTVSSIGNFGVLGPSGNNLTSCSDNPVLATRGASTVFAAIGTGLGATDTLAITGPGITIDNSSYFNAGGVEWHQVDITTAANAPLGPRNLEVTALSGDLTLLTATL